MIKIKGVRGVVTFCYFALFAYIFLGTQNLITPPTVVSDVLIIGFVTVSTIVDDWKLKIRLDKGFLYSIRHFVIPIGLIFAYSMLNQLIRGLSSDYLKHTITLCFRMVEYYALGIQCCRLFGKKTADYLLAVAILAYIPAFIRHFAVFGLVRGLLVLISPDIFGRQIELEVHTMTYIFGFLTLLYFYRLFVQKETNTKGRFIASLLMTVAGVKRIVLAALAAALILMVVLKFLKQKKRYLVMRLIALGMVLMAFAYLYLIRTGILEKVFDYIGIGASFRFNFWNHFRDRYTVNPMFMGYGISYGARVMQHEWRNIKDLSSVTNMHNDVLRIYLGLGFTGSLLYWYNFFYAGMRRIKRMCSVNTAMFSLVVSTYYFLTSMVANEGINALTNGVYFLMLYLMVCFDEEGTPKDKRCGETR